MLCVHAALTVCDAFPKSTVEHAGAAQAQIVANTFFFEDRWFVHALIGLGSGFPCGGVCAVRTCLLGVSFPA